MVEIEKVGTNISLTVLTYEVNKTFVPCVQQCILGTDSHHHRASIWRFKELNLPVMLTVSKTLHNNLIAMK